MKKIKHLFYRFADKIKGIFFEISIDQHFEFE
jgi:hypothetical protein